MPTYVYYCKACDKQFEAVQRITDTPLTECRECGGPVRKVISPVGIIFKGPGFYVTDHRKPEIKKDSGTTSTPSATGSTTKA